MAAEHLQYQLDPEFLQLDRPRLVLGFSGWMDGGNVSTGTLEWLSEIVGARTFATIDSEPFYIHSFPGTMEIASLFRPHGVIEDGQVRAFEWPQNVFKADEGANVVFFEGKEPNIHWRGYVDCIMQVAERLDVSTIYFIGSVGGVVTHTREPRILCTVSDESLKPGIEPLVAGFTDYEGPVGLVTYLLVEALRRERPMIALLAEIPAYIQGLNPKSIEVGIRTLASVLDLSVDLEGLRAQSDEWEKRVSEIVDEQDDLAEHIRRLEEDYDNEVFDTQMGDLKDWLQQRGIRLD